MLQRIYHSILYVHAVAYPLPENEEHPSTDKLINKLRGENSENLFIIIIIIVIKVLQQHTMRSGKQWLVMIVI